MSESVRDLYSSKWEDTRHSDIPFYVNGERVEVGTWYTCSTDSTIKPFPSGVHESPNLFYALSTAYPSTPPSPERETLTRALSLVRRMARGYDWTPDEVD